MRPPRRASKQRVVRKRFVLWIMGCLLATGLAGVIVVGSELSRPIQAEIGPPPRGLRAEVVEFPSRSGSNLKGWLLRRAPGGGAVVLMHGIRANRLAMLQRARFLSDAGYSVLLFDFQANGESVGRHQTFGYLESMDARAADRFMRSQAPGERVAALGCSLGGAAAILGPSPIEVDALIVEAVYPTIEDATANRIAQRLGPMGRLLTPLLIAQLRPRLGISPEDLRPIDRIGSIRAPLFLIAGAEDHDTTREESRRLFDAAHEPKQYWEIPGAGHIDFCAYSRVEYEKRVLEFLGRYLRGTGP